MSDYKQKGYRSASEMKRVETLKSEIDLRVSKYWICDECALKKGLVHPGGCGTVTKGLCGHCDFPSEVTLTPVVDFNDPKSGRKAWFD